MQLSREPGWPPVCHLNMWLPRLLGVIAVLESREKKDGWRSMCGRYFGDVSVNGARNFHSENIDLIQSHCHTICKGG